MVALRIVPSTEQRRLRSQQTALRQTAPRRRDAADTSDKPARSGLRFEAVPADAFLTGRIEPAFEVAMDHMTGDGAEVQSRRPLSPGRRISLMFPPSPFLPPTGTLARVEACERQPQGGYRLRLSFENMVAA